MKAKRILLIILAVLPLIVTLTALIFMPDEIPAHYGANFIVDRYGSKFETLILPAVILVISLLFLLPSFFMEKEINKKVTLSFGTALIIFLGLTQFYLLFIQAKGFTDLKRHALGIERFLLLGFGGLFMFTGNIMPTVRRNSFMGLRTPWSMKSDGVWKRSQRFGGISFMILGAALIILAFVFPNIFAMLGLILLTAAVDTVYSYIAFKTNNK